jgi:hypothetical protein
MYLEMKIAQWKRIKIPKELEKEFMQKVENREITESDQAIVFLNKHSEVIHDEFNERIETILPANNFGEATFQVFDKLDNLIFSNDIEDEKPQTL